MQKVWKNLETCSLENRTAVLLLSADLSLANKGHVLMMEQSRERLQRAGYEVVGAWLSPCCQERAAKEAKELQGQVPSARFRLALTQLVAEDSDLVAASSWESSLDHVVEPSQVAKELKQVLEKTLIATMTAKSPR